MADETTDLPGEELEPAERDELTREVGEQFPPPPDRSRAAAVVAAVLSVIAGILCVVAPFRAVYTLRTQGISASFDGWGRYDLASGNQHGPRYGVALTVAALVLVIAAASRLRDLRPAPPVDAAEAGAPDPSPSEGPATDPVIGNDRLASGIGIAGSALLLGILASLALNIESTLDNATAIAGSGGADTTVDVGGMLWFLVGAWVVSVVALYLPWFEARRRS